MLKNNTKIILIGLLVLGVLGLIYGYLNTRPEMIADSQLRVPEVTSPEFEKMINKSAGLSVDRAVQKQYEGGENLVVAPPEPRSEGSLDSTARETLQAREAFQIKDKVAGTSFDVTQSGKPNQSLKDTYLSKNQATEGAALEQQDTVDLSGESNESVQVDQTTGDNDVTKLAISKPAVNIEGSVLEDKPLESTSDVEVLSETDGFIDLNLTETKPIQMILLEGDDIIIDDVNEVLEKYRSPALLSINPAPLSISDVNTHSKLAQQAAPSINNELVKAQVKSQNLLENEPYRVGEEPLVLTELPVPDEALMAGTDPISLEYQASYQKLKMTTERLIKANARNADLKNQFKLRVDESERLAQIIRDINDEINVFLVKK